MSAATLFIDRDGTLIEEPVDEQVDSIAKVRFMPGVFAALSELTRRGYRLVMVTNQDGLGTASFPRVAFEEPQQFILEAFQSQGIRFDAVFVCPHRPSDGCGCRKPKTGLLDQYLLEHAIDRQASAVIGDRETDLAMTRLFGGYGPHFYAAYEAAWPLDAGAASRVRLYNLYHVLNHLNLFGSGYLRQALDMVESLNAELI